MSTKAKQIKDQTVSVKIELDTELQEHASKIGTAIGAYSKSSRVFAEAMRAAGIVLLSMPIPEGVVGNVWPMAELFLFTVRAKAWEAGPMAGTKMVLKEDQVLANALSGMRSLARGATLGGYIKNEDGTVITDTKDRLMRILSKSGDAAGNGFNPAIAEAKRFERMAKERARTDAEFAQLIGFDKNKPGGGRVAKEPSDARIDAVRETIKKCGVGKLDQIVTTLFESMGTQANDTEAQIKARELLNRALALVKEAETIINRSKELPANKPLAALDAAIRGVQQGKMEEPTHTDEVTSARKTRGRKTATTATVEQGTIRAAA